MRMSHLWAVVVVVVEHFFWLPCRSKPGALAPMALNKHLPRLIALIQAVEAAHRRQAPIQGDQAVHRCRPQRSRLVFLHCR